MLDKLKGMIFTDDAKPAQPKAVPQVAVQQIQVAQATLAPVDSVLDVAQLEAHLEASINSQDAFQPYATFKKASDSLSSVIADEKTRFKAASATTSISAELLLGSIAVVASVLETERTNFTQSFVASADTAIQLKETEAQSVTDQIQELTAKLGELSDSKNALVKEITQRQAELAKAKIDFESVFKTVAQRYTETSGKIQQYLGA